MPLTRAGFLAERDIISGNDTGDYVSIFKYGNGNSGSDGNWNTEIQAALDDPNYRTIYFPPGDYLVTRTLFSKQPGKKLLGAATEYGLSSLKFAISGKPAPAGCPGPVGIFFQNKGQVYNLNFQGVDLTREDNAQLVRFQRSIFLNEPFDVENPPEGYDVTGPGLPDEADMDSEIINCRFGAFKKGNPYTGSENYGGCAIFYWGRNATIKNCFFNGNGDAIVIGFPNNLSDPFSYQNPSQGGYYGFRRTRIQDNTYHSGDCRLIRLVGNVALRNALISGNLMDIGGQLLYCGSPGGMIGCVVENNTCFQNDNTGERNSYVRFDDGLCYDNLFIGNNFSGGDEIDGDRGYDYLWSTNTQGSVAKGFCAVNTSNLQSATLAYVNITDEDGQNITTCLQTILNTNATQVRLVISDRNIPEDNFSVYIVEGITYGNPVTTIQIRYTRGTQTTIPQGAQVFFNLNPQWPILDPNDNDDENDILGTKQPERIFQFGESSRIWGLNIQGNVLRCCQLNAISIRSEGIIGLRICDNEFRDWGTKSTIASCVTIQRAASEVMFCNNLGLQQEQYRGPLKTLIDFDGQVSSNIKVQTNVSNIGVDFARGTGNLTGYNVIEQK
jgi:hypothetical protein